MNVPEKTQQLARQVFAKELAQEGTLKPVVVTEKSSKSNGSGSMGYFFQLRLDELLEQIRINGHMVTFEFSDCHGNLLVYNVGILDSRLVIKEKNV